MFYIILCSKINKKKLLKSQKRKENVQTQKKKLIQSDLENFVFKFRDFLLFFV